MVIKKSTIAATRTLGLKEDKNGVTADITVTMMPVSPASIAAQIGTVAIIRIIISQLTP